MKDYLIVGQGLAGGVFARECILRGLSITVVDASGGKNASGVAGGIFNPITGKRWVRTWLDTELLPYAANYYPDFDARTGGSCYHPMPIFRLLRDDSDRQQFEERCSSDDVYARYAAAVLSADELPEGVLAPEGAVVLRGGGYVDIRQVCDRIREDLGQEEALLSEELRYDDLEPDEESVTWKGRKFRHAVFCEGHRVSANPWFDSIPFRHAKGEILTARIAGLSEEQIISAGIFICPLGSGRFRIGSTYEWTQLDDEPTEGARSELLDKVAQVCSLEVEVIEHRAGVRPIAYDRAPVAGRHPEHSRLILFNGFGSKGVLYAPYFANALLDHLEHGVALDPKVTVATHWKPERLQNG